MIYIKQYLLQF